MTEVLLERDFVARCAEYTVAPSTMPGVWTYEFRIGDEVRTGKTRTRIGLLANRRVQLQINRAFNDAARKARQ
jgi:hypothetical protein